MDESKNLSETGGSPSLVQGSGRSSEETTNQFGNEGSRPPALGSISAPVGDPSGIGRYRVIRPLGRGAFGQVYLAHDDSLDRPVAIKVPRP